MANFIGPLPSRSLLASEYNPGHSAWLASEAGRLRYRARKEGREFTAQEQRLYDCYIRAAGWTPVDEARAELARRSTVSAEAEAAARKLEQLIEEVDCSLS